MPTIHPIPAFQDNYIWLLEKGDNVVVVDPGDATVVETYLKLHGLHLAAILITHHHMDHVGGVNELVRRHQVPVYGPQNESIPNMSTGLTEGDLATIESLGLEFMVLDVPGHTLGHIAYYCDTTPTPILLCGDTLFSGGCGRLFEGTPSQMHDSLSKFSVLPANTLVYCTHEYTQANLKFAAAVEPNNKVLHSYIDEVAHKRSNDIPTVPSTIANELAINPFLRCDQSGVITGAENKTGRELKNAVDVFAAIRSWKDTF